MATCPTYECPVRWEPRPEISDCRVYTSGIYLQPCQIAFVALPPMFLASFFGCLMGLGMLILSCLRPGKAEASAPSMDTMSKSRQLEHGQL